MNRFVPAAAAAPSASQEPSRKTEAGATRCTQWVLSCSCVHRCRSDRAVPELTFSLYSQFLFFLRMVVFRMPESPVSHRLVFLRSNASLLPSLLLLLRARSHRPRPQLFALSPISPLRGFSDAHLSSHRNGWHRRAGMRRSSPPWTTSLASTRRRTRSGSGTFRPSRSSTAWPARASFRSPLS